MSDLCCIGHITKDKIVTPQQTVYMAGGTTYYFAYALSCLPKKIAFSAITKMNPTETEAVNELQERGTDIQLLPSRHTVFFENIYGQNVNYRQQRVLAKADPFSIEELQHVKTQIYHLGSLLQDDFSPEVIAYLASQGRVSIDVQGYLRKVKDQQVYPIDWKDKRKVLKHIYYIKVNETEMETITGLQDTHQAALLLHQWGVQEVCITLGDKGSLIYLEDKFYDIPAYKPQNIVDATGCGDTYSAGYLYCRMQGLDPMESGKFAAAMCTLKLEDNGPFHRTIEDIQRVIEESNIQ